VAEQHVASQPICHPNSCTLHVSATAVQARACYGDGLLYAILSTQHLSACTNTGLVCEQLVWWSTTSLMAFIPPLFLLLHCCCCCCCCGVMTGFTVAAGGAIVDATGRPLPRGLTIGPEGTLIAANGDTLPKSMKLGPNG
jgi:hypothetical protein